MYFLFCEKNFLLSVMAFHGRYIVLDIVLSRFLSATIEERPIHSVVSNVMPIANQVC